MFVQLSGAKLAEYGFVHITGLVAVGGLQGINDPKLSQEPKPIRARRSMCGTYHRHQMSFVITRDGEVWTGSEGQFDALSNSGALIVKALCPDGLMGGGYPLLGVMSPLDFYRRMGDPTYNLTVEDVGVDEGNSSGDPDPIAIVPPPGQAIETGAGAQPDAKAA